MEKTIKQVQQIYDVLHQLTGLHRQLLETVRLERTHLIDADLQAVHQITHKKQTLIESIHKAEATRLKLMTELSTEWKMQLKDLTLNQVIIEIQGEDPRQAQQLRSIYNALSLLIQRIGEQNAANKSLVENSLEHIRQMKHNVLGEAAQKAQTYTASGQKSSSSQSSRIYQGEA